MSINPPGVILGLHKNRDKNDFVVLMRVIGTEWPPVNINKVIKEYIATGAYIHAWWQPITLPE